MRHLFAWVNRPLSAKWVPYSLPTANCQHFALAFKRFLEGSHDSFVGANLTVAEALDYLRTDGLNLQLLPVSFKARRDCAIAAVRQNGLALEFVAPELLQKPYDEH